MLPNNTIPNSMSMEYNWLTFNGKAGPASTPLVMKQGERIRIRIINLGMDHHPIHLHGFTFWETGREGARQPEAIWPRGNTALVGVAQARDIEFIADRVGDWMFHCHLPHHMMNQMASRGGVTNGPLTPAEAMKAMGDMPGMDHASMHNAAVPDPNKIPLYPQDAFMEGPMMAMDKDVEKPETFGLPKNWSGFVGGMMTLVRVMQPEMFDKVMELKRQAGAK